MPDAQMTEVEDALSGAEAGGRAIRGGMIRVVGYGVGVLLTLVAAPLLLRHLGVGGFGQYVTVMSLVAIVALVADAGLTVLAIREYAVQDPAERRDFMANIVALRVVIAIAGVLGAVGFAAAADYDPELVAGTAVAGAGVVLTLIHQTYTVPLSVELRIATLTALELLMRVLTVAGIVLLVVLGSGIFAFLALTVPVAGITILATLFVVRHALRPQLRFDPPTWARLLRATIPVAAASILAALFYRLAVIVLSLVANDFETGLFSASLRVIEVIVPIPSLITGTAFPILALAATEAGDRFRTALGGLFEVALICGGATMIALTLGAEPIIDFLGGEEFAGAVPVLRIQAPATAATFVFAVWASGLWAAHLERRLVLATVIGVVCVIVLTIALAGSHGAEGAAVSMSVSEVVLTAAAGILLLRARRDVRISGRFVLKVLAALGAAGALWLTGLPGIVLAPLGLLVYAAVLAALGAVPDDIWHALRTGWQRVRPAR